jgi:hypothetical protein
LGHAVALTPYLEDTPRPSPRTNRTRRVPHPVLIGHVSSPRAPAGALNGASDLPARHLLWPAPAGDNDNGSSGNALENGSSGNALENGSSGVLEDGARGAHGAPARRAHEGGPPSPPPPSRTNWTRLVPPSVLIGHVWSLLPY